MTVSVWPLILPPALAIQYCAVCHCSRPKKHRRCIPNLKAVSLAFVWTFPILFLQSVVAWISIFFNGDRWESQMHSFLHFFFATYEFGDAYECGAQYANQ